MTKLDIIKIVLEILLIIFPVAFGVYDMRKAKETKDYIKYSEKKKD